MDKLGTAIAIRQLTQVENSRKKISVALGRPRRVGTTEWVCRFQIRGLDDSSIKNAFGVDALQALLNAVEGSRVCLEKTARPFESPLGIEFFMWPAPLRIPHTLLDSLQTASPRTGEFSRLLGRLSDSSKSPEIETTALRQPVRESRVFWKTRK